MLRTEDQNVLGLGLPFGRFTSFMLEEVANISASIGSGEIRLTPFRAILIPAVKTNISTACLTDLAGKGFIVEPHNPRLKIAACGGESACEQASTPAQADGLALAEMLAPLHSNQLHIHISGCTKGCAHPEPAPLTLVAHAGLYNVILNGTAADSPIAEGLNLTEIKSFLKQQLEHGALHGR
jgi:precorrin-3B synthase